MSTDAIVDLRKITRGSGPSRKRLSEIGAELLEVKEQAPTSPAQPSAMKKTIDAVIS